MVIRDLQEALWRVIEPQVDSPDLAADSHYEIIRIAIRRCIEEKADSLSMAELADPLDLLDQDVVLFLQHLSSKGIAGDPIAVT